MIDSIPLAPWQERQITKVLDDLIQTANPKLLSELTSGYVNDYSNLIDQLRTGIAEGIFLGKRMESANLNSLASIAEATHDNLCTHSYNYFKTTMIPDFQMGWRNIEWGNLIQIFNNVAFLCSRGSGKCFAPYFEVLMYDGSIKKIQDIKVGDKIMGPDNTERTVLKTHTGFDDMYYIKQKNGLDYIVNSKHDLYLSKWISKDITEEFKITAPDLLQKSSSFIKKCYGVRINGWDLPEQELKISPYQLGLYLSGDTQIENSLQSQLEEYNIHIHKYIPHIYLQSSRQQRLELLAGLLDANQTKNKSNTLLYSLTNGRLVKDVQYLAWSLGFRANISRHFGETNGKTNKIISYELHISGYINIIPLKVKQINSFDTTKIKSPHRSGIEVKYYSHGKYHGFTVDKDHMFLGADGTLHNNSFEFCYAFILWRLYTYKRAITRNLETIDNRNRKETIMITNERKLGRAHNEKVIEAIQNYDELKERINPRGKATLGVDRIVTENGAKMDVKSAFSFIRGRHVGSVVVDDFPDESSIYSKEMREKYKQIFYGAIKYIVEPYGHLIVSGTPYHAEDIYGTLRKDDAFMMFEYPAIFPDGTLLAPDRYTFDQLMTKKKTDGNIVFSQEVLVSPITDSSSLFPYEILTRSVDNMEAISLVSNIESYPVKFKTVAIGCDFAISGGIAADYTVFTVWGLTPNNQYYLIECWRKQGAKHNEQLAMIKSMDNRFKPNKIICEANNFQVILSDLAKDMGVRTIEEFTTHKGNKRSMKDGLPSLAAIFERDEIKIPYKHGRSKEIADWLLGEFNSIGFNQDKGTLESISEHDDGVMSSYMAIQFLRKATNSYKAYMV